MTLLYASTPTETSRVSRPIAGTNDDELYQTDRYGQSFSYEFVSYLIDFKSSSLASSLLILLLQPVVSGRYYNITIKLAETFENLDRRVFNIKVDDQVAFGNVDILQNVALDEAYDLEYTTEAMANRIVISFEGIIEFAKVCAIIVKEVI